MPRRFQSLLILSGLLLAGQAQAKYLMRELVDVPIKRLVANLERQARENPGKLQPVYALARLHSMAFALKDETVPAHRDGGAAYDGFGLEVILPPGKIEHPPTPEAELAARESLRQSIAWFRKALALAPDHAPSLLGLAWALEQSGEKEESIKLYRAAFRSAWEAEQDEERFPDLCLSCEAARYLAGRLDPVKDEEEIESLRASARQMAARPRSVTPILVPLEAEAPFEALAAPDARARFDLDGSGLAEWGWITPKAAWLVYDPRGTGRIESGLQLFGAVTFWIFWSDGYEALASLDDDGDGELRGSELGGLALWRDANGDGVSDPGEVEPVAAWGIVALACRGEHAREGLIVSPRGARLRDGSTLPTYDWSPPRK